MSRLYINTPADYAAYCGVSFLGDDMQLTANIDFKKATLNDGSPAWFEEERPYNSTYGSGYGILKWCPRLFNGNWVIRNNDAVAALPWVDYVAIAYDEFESYDIGNSVSFGGYVYDSLVNNNVGNSPDVSIDKWAVVSFSTYDPSTYVTHNGRYWLQVGFESSQEEPTAISSYWFEVTTLTVSASPSMLIPDSAADVLYIEAYLEENGGCWGGLLPIGFYAYGSGTNGTGGTSGAFLGTFDFNGFGIYNMYMDYRCSDAYATALTVPNNCCATCLFPRFGTDVSVDYARFNGSNILMVNPCVFSGNNAGVLFAYDTSTTSTTAVVNDMKIVNGFVLTQTRLAVLVGSRVLHKHIGKSDIEGTVVSEGLHAIEVASPTKSCMFGAIMLAKRAGDTGTELTFGDIKARGKVYSGPGCFCGGLFAAEETGTYTAINFGVVDLDIELIVSSTDKSTSDAGTRLGNESGFGLFIGVVKANTVAANLTTTITVGKLLCVGKVQLGGRWFGGYIVENSACAIGGVFGKCHTAATGTYKQTHTITITEAVVNVELLNYSDGGDGTYSRNNIIAAITIAPTTSTVTCDIGNTYVNSELGTTTAGLPIADEDQILLNSNGMKYKKNFSLLDFVAVWRIGVSNPVIKGSRKLNFINARIRRMLRFGRSRRMFSDNIYS